MDRVAVTHHMERFGEYLKKERELRSMTIEHISRVTRIHKKYLLALESGDDHLLPGQAIAKGFLRAYCGIVGLDAEEVLLRYESSKERSDPGKPPGTDGETAPRGRRVILGALIAVLIGVGVLLARNSRQTGPGDAPVSAATVPPAGVPGEDTIPRDTTGPAVVPGITRGDTGTEKSVPPPAAGKKFIVLRAAASHDTWIMARVDNQSPQEIILRANRQHEWTARKTLSVRVGNAGGISLILNDKPLGPLGPEGKVVGLVFTAP